MTGDNETHLASDGYYNPDESDLPGRYERVKISYTDALSFQFEAVAEDGKIVIRPIND